MTKWWVNLITTGARRQPGEDRMSARKRKRAQFGTLLVVIAALAAVSALAGGASTAAGETAASLKVTPNQAPTAPTALTVGDRTVPLNVEGTPTFGWLPHDPDG